jgi:predicted hotdog family 3-hydroxylacyl-ACP dehydratase
MNRNVSGFSVGIALLVASVVVADETERIGQVRFPISCAPAVQKPFERAVALLHSFWYLEAAKAFTQITQADPDCAIAYWGLALTNWTQIWAPPPPAALKRGWDAVEKAKAAGAKTPRERDFVAAAEAFFKDADKVDHRTRALAYGRAMEAMAQRYPQDREVMAFYALSLQATADPKDKTYASQKRSAEIAEKIFVAEPDHPGAAHYIIHGYDYPPLAHLALPAARRYAQFAPSVPHALHMPSHIYVLLGKWPETVKGNIAAAAAEKHRGNPDDHMHALDYLVYAYLQQAQDVEAKKIVDEARAIVADLTARVYDSGRPTAHFAMAAIEARWAMERGEWAEAAAIEPRPNRFPHTEAMIYFARAIGAARTGNAVRARTDVDKLAALKDAMKDPYWAEQIEIQWRAAAAWTARAEGKRREGFTLMRSAVELEASTEKHNITPGPIATARELLGDMLMETGLAPAAVEAYEASLGVAPNRFKALYGVAKAAERSGDRAKAKAYYAKLLDTAKAADTQRPELVEAKAFK